MNKIMITGRITHHPELKTTNNDVSVCSFSLAVKRPRTKDTTDFVNCTVWRQGADYITTYAKKGDMLGVVGVLTSRSFEDKNGNKRTAWEVQADEVEILSSKGQTEESGEPAETKDNGDPFEQVELSADLPF